MDLSEYVFEELRKDEEFILYRGQSKGVPSQFLLLLPFAEYPKADRLKVSSWVFALVCRRCLTLQASATPSENGPYCAHESDQTQSQLQRKHPQRCRGNPLFRKVDACR